MSSPLSVDQLEEYFRNNPIPAGLPLDSGARVTAPQQFLSSQLALYRTYGEAMQGKLGRDRLMKVMEVMEEGKKKEGNS